MEKNLEKITQETVLITKKAGKIVQEYFGKTDEDLIEFKAHEQDFVTKVDREVEEFLKMKLDELLPQARFFGEESGEDDGDEELRWVVDPIDGTRYFIRSLPMFSISVALMKGNESICGIIYQPYINHAYYAYKGGGSYVNGRKLEILEVKDLSKAIFYLDIDQFHKIKGEEKEWIDNKLAALMKSLYRIRLFGAASIASTHFVTGALNGFLDLTGRNPLWDIAAADIIMREAGAINDISL